MTRKLDEAGYVERRGNREKGGKRDEKTIRGYDRP